MVFQKNLHHSKKTNKIRWQLLDLVDSWGPGPDVSGDTDVSERNYKIDLVKARI